jgi:AGZA family xanthine/uracil permease-like MFS transporter
MPSTDFVGSMRRRLEDYFEFRALNTSWRTELLAGFTTFMTMAYIIFVNPSILKDTGMPPAAVTVATCLSAALGSILMGAYARYPIALAPGMGLNAYFAYTVVQGMGVDWRVALGAVFFSGVAFLALTAAGLRRMIVEAIPQEMYASVAAGIGLFIAFIGMKNCGFIAASPATLVTIGNLRDPQAALAAFGLILTAALMVWKIPAAMLAGILGTTAAGLLLGIVPWTRQDYNLSAIAGTMGKLDIAGTLRIGVIEIVFVFLFVDLFDNIGTLIGVGKRAGLFDNARSIPRIQRILTTDSVATIAGSLAGTSTVVSYVESAAGVAVGGRSGVTAIVCGVLFLAAAFIAPLVGGIPSSAAGPALIIVGSLMMSHSGEIDWQDPLLAVPSFLTMIAIPLTFSIANGLAIGFIAYTALKLARGEFREINPLVYLLTALFLLRFLYLGGA